MPAPSTTSEPTEPSDPSAAGRAIPLPADDPAIFELDLRGLRTRWADRAAMSPIAEWVTAAQEGRFLTTPSLEIAKDWIYVDDVGEAFARLVEARELRHAMYNLGLGENVTVGEIIEHLRRAWPRLEVNVMPSWTPNPNLSAARLRPPLEMTRLAADVGYRPRFGIAEGLARYAAWVKERSPRTA